MSKKILKEEREKIRAADMRLKEKIIAKIEQHPLLYDKRNPQYLNKKLKDDIMGKIGGELGLTAKELQTKWKSLRDAYVKEKSTRDNESMSGAGSSKRKPFELYEQMGFLQQFIRKRRSLSTVEDSDDEAKEDDEKEDEENATQNETQMANMDFGQDDEDVGSNFSFDMSRSPDRKAWEQFKKMEEEDLAKAEKEKVAVSLFPNQQPIRRSPRKTDSTVTSPQKVKEVTSSKKVTPSPAKTPKLSQSLTPNIPILSPKSETKTHRDRSKAKKEAEINDEIKKVVSVLEKTISGPQKNTSEDADLNLGISLGNALKGLKNPIAKNKWRRQLRMLLCDIEDEIAAED